jgi:peptide deformylase
VLDEICLCGPSHHRRQLLDNASTPLAKSPSTLTMAIHPILKMGDPRLLRIAQPVTAFGTPALKSLVEDMFETMIAAKGAGLAAPQIGVDLQLVIFGFERNERYPQAQAVPQTVLINPVIEPLPDETAEPGSTQATIEDGWEGCLSVPGLRGQVPRWRRIRYTCFDLAGQPIDRIATEFHARVVQHECDHLIGRLYPTRMTDLTKLGFTSVLFPEMDPNADD